LAIASFFVGRDWTRPIIAANLLGTAFHAPLAYAFINGWSSAPELGITTGAANAQVAAWEVTAAALAIMIRRTSVAVDFGLHSRHGGTDDERLLSRLLRYGLLSSGAQFVVKVAVATCFVLLGDRLDAAELSLTNMVKAMDSLAFLLWPEPLLPLFPARCDMAEASSPPCCAPRWWCWPEPLHAARF
jgi:Na+-driven multidrug efflux pump